MAWSVAANIRQRGHGTGSRGGNASRERKQESDQQNMTYQQRLGATPAGYQQNPKLSPQRQHRDGQHREGQQSGQQPGQQSGQHSRQQHSKSSSSSPESRERVRRGSSPPTQPKDDTRRKVSRGSPVRVKRPSPAGTEHAQQHMSRSLPHEYMRHFPQDAMRRQEEHAQSAARRSPTQPRRRYRQHHDTTADTERIKTRSSPEKHSSRQTQEGEKDRRQRQSYTSSV
ncbi:uncharacterized protein LOC144923911 [Branchiostoma floridae x Branchiostoma belcheri]